MQKTTQELLNQLKTVHDIGAFLNEHEGELLNETPQAYLNGLLLEKNLKTAEVSERSGLGDYVYKIFAGARRASRDILLAVAFGMGLSLTETQQLLRISHQAQLDPRNRRDSILIYALENTLTVNTANEILFDLGEATL